MLQKLDVTNLTLSTQTGDVCWNIPPPGFHIDVFLPAEADTSTKYDVAVVRLEDAVPYTTHINLLDHLDLLKGKSISGSFSRKQNNNNNNNSDNSSSTSSFRLIDDIATLQNAFWRKQLGTIENKHAVTRDSLRQGLQSLHSYLVGARCGVSSTYEWSLLQTPICCAALNISPNHISVNVYLPKKSEASSSVRMADSLKLKGLQVDCVPFVPNSFSGAPEESSLDNNKNANNNNAASQKYYREDPSYVLKCVAGEPQSKHIDVQDHLELMREHGQDDEADTAASQIVVHFRRLKPNWKYRIVVFPTDGSGNLLHLPPSLPLDIVTTTPVQVSLDDVGDRFCFIRVGRRDFAGKRFACANYKDPSLSLTATNNNNNREDATSSSNYLFSNHRYNFSLMQQQENLRKLKLQQALLEKEQEEQRKKEEKDNATPSTNVMLNKQPKYTDDIGEVTAEDLRIFECQILLWEDPTPNLETIARRTTRAHQLGRRDYFPKQLPLKRRECSLHQLAVNDFRSVLFENLRPGSTYFLQVNVKSNKIALQYDHPPIRMRFCTQDAWHLTSPVLISNQSAYLLWGAAQKIPPRNPSRFDGLVDYPKNADNWNDRAILSNNNNNNSGDSKQQQQDVANTKAKKGYLPANRQKIQDAELLWNYAPYRTSALPKDDDVLPVRYDVQVKEIRTGKTWVLFGASSKSQHLLALEKAKKSTTAVTSDKEKRPYDRNRQHLYSNSSSAAAETMAANQNEKREEENTTVRSSSSASRPTDLGVLVENLTASTSYMIRWRRINVYEKNTFYDFSQDKIVESRTSDCVLVSPWSQPFVFLTAGPLRIRILSRSHTTVSLAWGSAEPAGQISAAIGGGGGGGGQNSSDEDELLNILEDEDAELCSTDSSEQDKDDDDDDQETFSASEVLNENGDDENMIFSSSSKNNKKSENNNPMKKKKTTTMQMKDKKSTRKAKTALESDVSASTSTGTYYYIEPLPLISIDEPGTFRRGGLPPTLISRLRNPRSVQWVAAATILDYIQWQKDLLLRKIRDIDDFEEDKYRREQQSLNSIGYVAGGGGGQDNTENVNNKNSSIAKNSTAWFDVDFDQDNYKIEGDKMILKRKKPEAHDLLFSPWLLLQQPQQQQNQNQNLQELHLDNLNLLQHDSFIDDKLIADEVENLHSATQNLNGTTLNNTFRSSRILLRKSQKSVHFGTFSRFLKFLERREEIEQEEREKQRNIANSKIDRKRAASSFSSPSSTTTTTTLHRKILQKSNINALQQRSSSSTSISASTKNNSNSEATICEGITIVLVHSAIYLEPQLAPDIIVNNNNNRNNNSNQNLLGFPSSSQTKNNDDNTTNNNSLTQTKESLFAYHQQQQQIQKRMKKKKRGFMLRGKGYEYSRNGDDDYDDRDGRKAREQGRDDSWEAHDARKQRREDAEKLFLQKLKGVELLPEDGENNKNNKNTNQENQQENEEEFDELESVDSDEAKEDEQISLRHPHQRQLWHHQLKTIIDPTFHPPSSNHNSKNNNLRSSTNEKFSSNFAAPSSFLQTPLHADSSVNGIDALTRMCDLNNVKYDIFRNVLKNQPSKTTQNEETTEAKNVANSEVEQTKKTSENMNYRQQQNNRNENIRYHEFLEKNKEKILKMMSFAAASTTNQTPATNSSSFSSSSTKNCFGGITLENLPLEFCSFTIFVFGCCGDHHQKSSHLHHHHSRECRKFHETFVSADQGKNFSKPLASLVISAIPQTVKPLKDLRSMQAEKQQRRSTLHAMLLQQRNQLNAKHPASSASRPTGKKSPSNSPTSAITPLKPNCVSNFPSWISKHFLRNHSINLIPKQQHELISSSIKISSLPSSLISATLYDIGEWSLWERDIRIPAFLSRPSTTLIHVSEVSALIEINDIRTNQILHENPSWFKAIAASVLTNTTTTRTRKDTGEDLHDDDDDQLFSKIQKQQQKSEELRLQKMLLEQIDDWRKRLKSRRNGGLEWSLLELRSVELRTMEHLAELVTVNTNLMEQKNKDAIEKKQRQGGYNRRRGDTIRNNHSNSPSPPVSPFLVPRNNIQFVDYSGADENNKNNLVEADEDEIKYQKLVSLYGILLNEKQQQKNVNNNNNIDEGDDNFETKNNEKFISFTAENLFKELLMLNDMNEIEEKIANVQQEIAELRSTGQNATAFSQNNSFVSGAINNYNYPDSPQLHAAPSNILNNNLLSVTTPNNNTSLLLLNSSSRNVLQQNNHNNSVLMLQRTEAKKHKLLHEQRQKLMKREHMSAKEIEAENRQDRRKEIDQELKDPRQLLAAFSAATEIISATVENEDEHPILQKYRKLASFLKINNNHRSNERPAGKKNNNNTTLLKSRGFDDDEAESRNADVSDDDDFDDLGVDEIDEEDWVLVGGQKLEDKLRRANSADFFDLRKARQIRHAILAAEKNAEKSRCVEVIVEVKRTGIVESDFDSEDDDEDSSDDGNFDDDDVDDETIEAHLDSTTTSSLNNTSRSKKSLNKNNNNAYKTAKHHKRQSNNNKRQNISKKANNSDGNAIEEGNNFTGAAVARGDTEQSIKRLYTICSLGQPLLIPSLHSNTRYEVRLRRFVPSTLRWSGWSDRLTFVTGKRTFIQVQELAPHHVSLRWDSRHSSTMQHGAVKRFLIVVKRTPTAEPMDRENRRAILKKKKSKISKKKQGEAQVAPTLLPPPIERNVLNGNDLHVEQENDETHEADEDDDDEEEEENLDYENDEFFASNRHNIQNTVQDEIDDANEEENILSTNNNDSIQLDEKGNKINSISIINPEQAKLATSIIDNHNNHNNNMSDTLDETASNASTSILPDKSAMILGNNGNDICVMSLANRIRLLHRRHFSLNKMTDVTVQPQLDDGSCGTPSSVLRMLVLTPEVTVKLQGADHLVISWASLHGLGNVVPATRNAATTTSSHPNAIHSTRDAGGDEADCNNNSPPSTANPQKRKRLLHIPGCSTFPSVVVVIRNSSRTWQRVDTVTEENAIDHVHKLSGLSPSERYDVAVFVCAELSVAPTWHTIPALTDMVRIAPPFSRTVQTLPAPSARVVCVAEDALLLEWSAAAFLEQGIVHEADVAGKEFPIEVRVATALASVSVAIDTTVATAAATSDRSFTSDDSSVQARGRTWVTGLQPDAVYNIYMRQQLQHGRWSSWNQVVEYAVTLQGLNVVIDELTESFVVARCFRKKLSPYILAADNNKDNVGKRKIVPGEGNGIQIPKHDNNNNIQFQHSFSTQEGKRLIPNYHSSAFRDRNITFGFERQIEIHEPIKTNQNHLFVVDSKSHPHPGSNKTSPAKTTSRTKTDNEIMNNMPRSRASTLTLLDQSNNNHHHHRRSIHSDQTASTNDPRRHQNISNNDDASSISFADSNNNGNNHEEEREIQEIPFGTVYTLSPRKFVFTTTHVGSDAHFKEVSDSHSCFIGALEPNTPYTFVAQQQCFATRDWGVKSHPPVHCFTYQAISIAITKRTTTFVEVRIGRERAPTRWATPLCFPHDLASHFAAVAIQQEQEKQLEKKIKQLEIRQKELQNKQKGVVSSTTIKKKKKNRTSNVNEQHSISLISRASTAKIANDDEEDEEDDNDDDDESFENDNSDDEEARTQTLLEISTELTALEALNISKQQDEINFIEKLKRKNLRKLRQEDAAVHRNSEQSEQQRAADAAIHERHQMLAMSSRQQGGLHAWPIPQLVALHISTGPNETQGSSFLQLRNKHSVKLRLEVPRGESTLWSGGICTLLTGLAAEANVASGEPFLVTVEAEYEGGRMSGHPMRVLSATLPLPKVSILFVGDSDAVIQIEPPSLRPSQIYPMKRQEERRSQMMGSHDGNNKNEKDQKGSKNANGQKSSAKNVLKSQNELDFDFNARDATNDGIMARPASWTFRTTGCQEIKIVSSHHLHHNHNLNTSTISSNTASTATPVTSQNINNNTATATTTVRNNKSNANDSNSVNTSQPVNNNNTWFTDLSNNSTIIITHQVPEGVPFRLKNLRRECWNLIEMAPQEAPVDESVILGLQQQLELSKKQKQQNENETSGHRASHNNNNDNNKKSSKKLNQESDDDEDDETKSTSSSNNESCASDDSWISVSEQFFTPQGIFRTIARVRTIAPATIKVVEIAENFVEVDFIRDFLSNFIGNAFDDMMASGKQKKSKHQNNNSENNCNGGRNTILYMTQNELMIKKLQSSSSSGGDSAAASFNNNNNNNNNSSKNKSMNPSFPSRRGSVISTVSSGTTGTNKYVFNESQNNNNNTSNNVTLKNTFFVGQNKYSQLLPVTSSSLLKNMENSADPNNNKNNLDNNNNQQEETPREQNNNNQIKATSFFGTASWTPPTKTSAKEAASSLFSLTQREENDDDQSNNNNNNKNDEEVTNNENSTRQQNQQQQSKNNNRNPNYFYPRAVIHARVVPLNCVTSVEKCVFSWQRQFLTMWETLDDEVTKSEERKKGYHLQKTSSMRLLFNNNNSSDLLLSPSTSNNNNNKDENKKSQDTETIVQDFYSAFQEQLKQEKLRQNNNKQSNNISTNNLSTLDDVVRLPFRDDATTQTVLPDSSGGFALEICCIPVVDLMENLASNNLKLVQKFANKSNPTTDVKQDDQENSSTNPEESEKANKSKQRLSLLLNSNKKLLLEYTLRRLRHASRSLHCLRDSHATIAGLRPDTLYSMFCRLRTRLPGGEIGRGHIVCGSWGKGVTFRTCPLRVLSIAAVGCDFAVCDWGGAKSAAEQDNSVLVEASRSLAAMMMATTTTKKNRSEILSRQEDHNFDNNNDNSSMLLLSNKKRNAKTQGDEESSFFFDEDDDDAAAGFDGDEQQEEELNNDTNFTSSSSSSFLGTNLLWGSSLRHSKLDLALSGTDDAASLVAVAPAVRIQMRVVRVEAFDLKASRRSPSWFALHPPFEQRDVGDTTFEVDTFAPPRRIIHGLNPGTKYRVSLRSCYINDQFGTWLRPVMIRTDSCFAGCVVSASKDSVVVSIAPNSNMTASSSALNNNNFQRFLPSALMNQKNTMDLHSNSSVSGLTSPVKKGPNNNNNNIFGKNTTLGQNNFLSASFSSSNPTSSLASPGGAVLTTSTSNNLFLLSDEEKESGFAVDAGMSSDSIVVHRNDRIIEVIAIPEDDHFSALNSPSPFVQPTATTNSSSNNNGPSFSLGGTGGATRKQFGVSKIQSSQTASTSASQVLEIANQTPPPGSFLKCFIISGDLLSKPLESESLNSRPNTRQEDSEPVATSLPTTTFSQYSNDDDDGDDHDASDGTPSSLSSCITLNHLKPNQPYWIFVRERIDGKPRGGFFYVAMAWTLPHTPEFVGLGECRDGYSKLTWTVPGLRPIVPPDYKQKMMEREMKRQRIQLFGAGNTSEILESNKSDNTLPSEQELLEQGLLFELQVKTIPPSFVVNHNKKIEHEEDSSHNSASKIITTMGNWRTVGVTESHNLRFYLALEESKLIQRMLSLTSGFGNDEKDDDDDVDEDGGQDDKTNTRQNNDDDNDTDEKDHHKNKKKFKKRSVVELMHNSVFRLRCARQFSTISNYHNTSNSVSSQQQLLPNAMNSIKYFGAANGFLNSSFLASNELQQQNNGHSSNFGSIPPPPSPPAPIWSLYSPAYKWQVPDPPSTVTNFEVIHLCATLVAIRWSPPTHGRRHPGLFYNVSLDISQENDLDSKDKFLSDVDMPSYAVAGLSSNKNNNNNNNNSNSETNPNSAISPALQQQQEYLQMQKKKAQWKILDKTDKSYFRITSLLPSTKYRIAIQSESVFGVAAQSYVHTIQTRAKKNLDTEPGPRRSDLRGNGPNANNLVAPFSSVLENNRLSNDDGSCSALQENTNFMSLSPTQRREKMKHEIRQQSMFDKYHVPERWRKVGILQALMMGSPTSQNLGGGSRFKSTSSKSILSRMRQQEKSTKEQLIQKLKTMRAMLRWTRAIRKVIWMLRSLRNCALALCDLSAARLPHPSHVSIKNAATGKVVKERPNEIPKNILRIAEKFSLIEFNKKVFMNNNNKQNQIIEKNNTDDDKDDDAEKELPYESVLRQIILENSNKYNDPTSNKNPLQQFIVDKNRNKKEKANDDDDDDESDILNNTTGTNPFDRSQTSLPEIPRVSDAENGGDDDDEDEQKNEKVKTTKTKSRQQAAAAEKIDKNSFALQLPPALSPLDIVCDAIGHPRISFLEKQQSQEDRKGFYFKPSSYDIVWLPELVGVPKHVRKVLEESILEEESLLNDLGNTSQIIQRIQNQSGRNSGRTTSQEQKRKNAESRLAAKIRLGMVVASSADASETLVDRKAVALVSSSSKSNSATNSPSRSPRDASRNKNNKNEKEDDDDETQLEISSNPSSPIATKRKSRRMSPSNKKKKTTNTADSVTPTGIIMSSTKDANNDVKASSSPSIATRKKVVGFFEDVNNQQQQQKNPNVANVIINNANTTPRKNCIAI